MGFKTIIFLIALIAAINFFQITSQSHFNAHRKARGLAEVSCAKMDELIEMQFETVSWVGPGTCITWECRSSMGRGTFGGVF